ncbi:hypothetical protein CANCADRAFT_25455 [Tortispora caseinolytica NRRL Y-17796]|uniref:Nucleolar protein 12 n=1 Tax=Tortispora caseinolytica NRRL Y-17796 TaxID=767744 RepID=A0A1E4TH14_9ASCO|nr:hypothetical protein CANCADRAFT_25455 [Tortispora caseinolytica NRRL Y-17796]
MSGLIDEAPSRKKSRSKDANDAKDVKLPKPVEQELEKAPKTIFVGNIPSSVILDKAVYKRFKKLFRNIGSVDSIRFRSIGFKEILPRKTAFLAGKINENSTVNAYVVFTDDKDAKKSLNLNGTVFENHHLRIDSIMHPRPQDPRRSVFIGNLEFETIDEDVYKHFQKCGNIEYVRLIRDSTTNLGKGFGYVQFVDSVAVEKALLLNGKPMKNRDGKSRNLRVSQAKRILMNKRKTELQVKKIKKSKKSLNDLDADSKSALGRYAKIVNKHNRSNKKARVTKRSTEFKKKARELKKK